MGNLWVVLLLVGLSAIGWLYGRGQQKDESEAKYKGIYSQYMADGKLDRTEVNQLLAKLPEAIDRDLKLGAMCYKVISTRDLSEYFTYTCPACLRNTGYATKKTKPEVIARLRNIEEQNRLLKQVKGIQIKLDGRQFCGHCSRHVEDPQAFFIINFQDGSKPMRVSGISNEDLKILIEFCNGAVVHTGGGDRETLLSSLKSNIIKILQLEKKQD